MQIVTINMNTCSQYEHDDKWSLRTRLHVSHYGYEYKKPLKTWILQHVVT